MTNREIVLALYEDFGAGDIDAIVSLMAAEIVWHEAEHNKLADRNPDIGPEAIVEGVFARGTEDFDEFAVEIGHVVEDDDTLLTQGRYRAREKASGTEINSQIVHWWTIGQDRHLPAVCGW